MKRILQKVKDAGANLFDEIAECFDPGPFKIVKPGDSLQGDFELWTDSISVLIYFEKAEEFISEV